MEATIPQHVHFGTNQAVLQQITDHGCNLAIWDRASHIPQAHVKALDALNKADFPVSKIFTDRTSYKKTLQQVIFNAFPEGEFRDWLLADLISLCDMYFELTQEQFIRVRLNSTDKVPCPRFHQDYVGVRLICTYRGAGTEWVPNHLVCPDLLGVGAENCSIVRRGDAVKRIPRFAVACLKGSNQNDGTFGIVHRSPDAGQRMLVVINADARRQAYF